ncbi:MAG: septum formation initiator family protein [Caldilineaceae bacterium]
MSTPKRNPRILWFLVLFLCLFFVISYGGRLATKARLEAEIAGQVARIEQAEQHQQALQQQLAYVRSDAYVEATARNELGMVRPGDEVLIVVEGPPPVAAESTVTPPAVAPPFWQEWLQRLGL